MHPPSSTLHAPIALELSQRAVNGNDHGKPELSNRNLNVAGGTVGPHHRFLCWVPSAATIYHDGVRPQPDVERRGQSPCASSRARANTCDPLTPL